MTASSQRPPVLHPSPENPLTACLIALAGTPDDASWIDSQLLTITQLSADLMAPVTYASVTAYRAGAMTTVAVSSDIVREIDQAQYDDSAGPCLDSLDDATPVAVPDIAATMQWPGFRDTAYRLGIKASLSVPLFAGSGTAIAALNLYSHDPDGLEPLAVAVRIAYDPEFTAAGTGRSLDDGGEALIAGLVGAFAVRARIQQTIGMVMATSHRDADAAYLALRLRAAETGASLIDTATAVMAEREQADLE